jgi:hypothetical protein
VITFRAQFESVLTIEQMRPSAFMEALAAGPPQKLSSWHRNRSKSRDKSLREYEANVITRGLSRQRLQLPRKHSTKACLDSLSGSIRRAICTTTISVLVRSGAFWETFYKLQEPPPN